MGVDLDTGPSIEHFTDATIGLEMIASGWDTLPSTQNTLKGKSSQPLHGLVLQGS